MLWERNAITINKIRGAKSPPWQPERNFFPLKPMQIYKTILPFVNSFKNNFSFIRHYPVMFILRRDAINRVSTANRDICLIPIAPHCFERTWQCDSIHRYCEQCGRGTAFARRMELRGRGRNG